MHVLLIFPAGFRPFVPVAPGDYRIQRVDVPLTRSLLWVA